MKRIVIISFSFIICLLLLGCDNKNKTFSLSEEYYKTNSFNELDKDSFNELIDKKKSFAIFIYQPLCTTSYEFNKILTEFAEDYQISFYKMSFADMKNTNLNDSIKYYPSLAIFHEGKLIDYLDANDDDDIEYYKSVSGFKKWFSSYVSIKKVDKKNISNNNLNTNVGDNKIDTELKNITYDENKVNIYFFWGDGCPHCEEEFKFLKSIETEYGDYFKLNTFEVWHNEDNEKILNEFADVMDDEVTGVPYTIIGKETFKGFSEKYENRFLDAIKTQYKNSYDVYFSNK